MIVMYLLFAFVNIVGGIPQGWIEDGFAALQAYAVQNIPEVNYSPLYLTVLSPV